MLGGFFAPWAPKYPQGCTLCTAERFIGDFAKDAKNTSSQSLNIRARVANLKPASKRRLYFVYYQALAGWVRKYRRRFKDYNPQNAWRIFRSLSTKISARLYFVYCLRNFVCEEAKKTQWFKDSAPLCFTPPTASRFCYLYSSNDFWWKYK